MLTSENTFTKHINSFSSFSPNVIERKKAEWAKFLELPMPERKNETWRFSSHRKIDLDAFSVESEVDEKIVEKVVDESDLILDSAGSLVFVDGKLVHANIDPALTEQGVIWMSIADAFARFPEIIAQYFLREKANLGSEKFVALNGALTSSGSLLYVPRNVCIEKPFVSYHWSDGRNVASFPHTLIIAGENSSVNMLDFYQSTDDESPAFVCAVGDIYAGKGAKVFRKNVQNLNEKTLSFIIDANIADKDAHVTTLGVHLGCYRARAEQLVDIKGEGAHVEMLALTVADQEQEFDQRTLQIHSAGNSFSNLLYKNALMDKATTIFSGLIRVEPGAQKTDAYQKNRNLILSSEAQAHTLPGLEIEANDVKCSHGATASSVEPEELFYLLARGIPRKTAYELLVMGFFEEVVAKIDNKQLVEKLHMLLQGKFSARNV